MKKSKSAPALKRMAPSDHENPFTKEIKEIFMGFLNSEMIVTSRYEDDDWVRIEDVMNLLVLVMRDERLKANKADIKHIEDMQRAYDAVTGQGALMKSFFEQYWEIKTSSGRGPKANKARAEKHIRYLQERYTTHRADGVATEKARAMANDDMKDKFRVPGYKKSRLYALLKG